MNTNTLHKIFQSSNFLCKNLPLQITSLNILRNHSTKSCASQTKALNEKDTKPATHVIIEADGVLLDSMRYVMQSHDMYLVKWKKRLNPTLRAQIVGKDPVEVGDIITKELNLPISGQTYAEGIWPYQRDLLRKNRVRLMKGIDDLLCYFNENGIPTAVVSTYNEKAWKLKTRKHRDIEDLFCHIVFSTDGAVRSKKPSPDIFLVAARRFKRLPSSNEKVLVIESSINGVKGAKAAGMQTVLLPDSNLPRTKVKEADVTIMNVESFEPRDFDFPKKNF